ncbi:hypothetical protein MJK71_13420 [Escherichia coli]|nr:hypothetical protein MJK71_13420 [Escherichia coli]
MARYDLVDRLNTTFFARWNKSYCILPFHQALSNTSLLVARVFSLPAIGKKRDAEHNPLNRHYSGGKNNISATTAQSLRYVPFPPFIYLNNSPKIAAARPLSVCLGVLCYRVDNRRRAVGSAGAYSAHQ